MLLAMTRPIIELGADDFPENTRAVVHLDDAPAKVAKRTYRKRILRFGRWSHTAAPGGILDVDRAYGERLAENFRKGIFDSVSTVKGHPKTEAEAIALNAGDVVAVDTTDDGVYATVRVPQDVGDAIDSGALKGCSAGIIPDYVDKELNGHGRVGPVLEHLAFTNSPYIKGLGDFSPVHLADQAPTVLLSLTSSPTKETPMDRAELIAKAKELGVDIETLEADAAKVTTLTTERDAALAAAEAAKVIPKPDPTAEQAAVEATKEIAKGELVTALSTAFTEAGLITLSEGSEPTLAGLVGAIASGLKEGKDTKDALLLSEATADVDEAQRVGKILPTQRDAMLKVRLSDPETFKAILPSSPIVDLSEHGTTGADAASLTLSDGTPVDDEVKRLIELADSI